MGTTILKGNIAWSDRDRSILTCDHGYLVFENDKVAGVFDKLPENYSGANITDYGDKLIIPGMTDLHTHAPQYGIRGLGMDAELMDWLKKYTFPEEAKFAEESYADRMYDLFIEDLLYGWTTRAVIFASLHTKATEMLMEKLDSSGLVTYVGRVNMDRDGGKDLVEKDAKTALRDTEEWIKETAGKYKNTKPIITPRFIPSCSDELMLGLSGLAEKYGLMIQSHLCENPGEIALVKKLVPDSEGYTDSYRKFGSLQDSKHPSVMAHCVYLRDDEIQILKEYGTYIAHCPGSNLNLASGIAPAAKYLRESLNIGIGTDIGAGESLSMPHQVVQALQSSNMYWRMKDETVWPLSFAEAFYMATLGGGSYFGKTGSFIKDYDGDAIVLDDSEALAGQRLPLTERLERAVYLSEKCVVEAKYVRGLKIVG